MDSIGKDVEKVTKDIYTAEEKEVKKLHQEKQEGYSDKLVKLKVRVNK